MTADEKKKASAERARFRSVMRDLTTKRRVPPAIKSAHYDIEDAVAAAGGERGKLRNA